MGTASAVPANLYRYSDQCTQAAQQLQAWVRAVLAPALHAYLQGAAARQDGSNVDISGVRSRAGSVDGELPRQIAAAYYTDREVRDVGSLFQQAGSAGQLPPLTLGGQLGSPPDRPVRTTDEQLDATDLRDGAALARMLPEAEQFGGPVAAWYWQRLARQSDDPLFCAGYYNALSREQLERQPWNSGTAQALAAAFASGQLTPAAKASIIWVLLDRNNSTGEVPTAVFRALAGNPPGAAGFARYLQTQPNALRLMLRGKGWGDWYPGFHNPGGQGQFLSGLLQVFTAAATTMDPSELRALTAAVGRSLPQLSISDSRTAEPQLQRFLTAAAVRLLPRPVPEPGTPYQQTLQKWAAAYGVDMQNLLRPYQDWLAHTYQGSQQAGTLERALAENIMLGAIGAIITAPIGGEGGIALPALVANGAYGGGAGLAQPYLDKLLAPDGAAPTRDPKNYLHKTAIVAVVVAALRRGLVGGDGKPITLEQFQHDPTYSRGLAALLAAVERGEHPSAGDTDWAYGLTLTDGGNLGAVIDALRSHFQ